MMDNLSVVVVPPIQWPEWSEFEGVGYAGEGEEPVPYGRPHCHTPYFGQTAQHTLTELGQRTSTYKYTVYRHWASILTVTIKLPCCRGRGTCPIGKHILPQSPCRQALRASAQAIAYTHWVQFLQLLADS
jgi:hypothetical protein